MPVYAIGIIAAIQSNAEPWTLAAIIFSAFLSLAAALIGALVLRNLKHIDQRVDSHDKRLDRIENENRQLAQRKAQCQQDFVSSEQWAREAGYTRKQLDKTLEAISTLTGKMDAMELLPRTCSQIAGETVEAIFNRINSGGNLNG